MKFSCSVIVNQSRDKVVRLFSDPAYLGEYQDGFLRKELLSGSAGETGAVSKMYYKMGKRNMELTETILENNLPEEFLGMYHHVHMDNFMRCQFRALSDLSTEYISEIEYTAFRGFFPKAMAILFPGIFKKQVQKWMNNFKKFVEEFNE